MKYWQVYIVSAGGVKYEHMSFETEKEAVEYCNDCHWEWADENCFVWDLEIEEVLS